MSTPAENQGIAKLQQTVEAALDNLLAIVEAAEHEGRWHLSGRDVINVVESVKVIGAALRDLVAQADRAAELEAALREIDKMDGRYNDLNTARHRARKALAGDGGGA